MINGHFFPFLNSLARPLLNITLSLKFLSARKMMSCPGVLARAPVPKNQDFNYFWLSTFLTLLILFHVFSQSSSATFNWHLIKMLQSGQGSTQRRIGWSAFDNIFILV